ncbi:hypothetical protein GOP47_0019767 [Adiantum capillus-veneris]|uniref:Uncharacterized protein n=1 Tax=Adiantum capillus-veneris TaxID=13818 RepID=A0A9D4UC50_ADICA|nr:hypothetical protein GOP47_0019767 [Adiantum capillus-veneris]
MDSSSPQIGGELPFRLCLSGHSGHLRVEPLPPVRKDTPFSSLPDFILPPALPKETPESIRESIEHKYLVPALDHEEDRADRCGKVWDFEWLDEGVSFSKPSIPRSVVMPVWEPPYRRTKQLSSFNQNSMDGSLEWIPDFEEVESVHHDEASHNSSSVLRKPGPPEDFVRGSTSNHPFLPGGFDVSSSFDKKHAESRVISDGLQVLWEGGQLLTIPPGFTRGLNLEAPEPLSVRRKDAAVSQLISSVQHGAKELGKVSLLNIFRQAWEQETNSKLIQDGAKPSDTDLERGNESQKPVEIKEDILEAEMGILDNILADVKKLKVSVAPAKEKDSGMWAIKGGHEGLLERFSAFVPEMALSYPFELDAFQKEAIYHLENGESVFVAAHTSAGKTVVAEYAFALSTKHCTRAVYTSPIKTISNQKYRDFSDRFDVGIITGDVSLKPEASCLIMTTEILRSMLYKGADIIRDIEWVIFDEVHYVNDAERGVVWEEVIIMLPDHVNMVLLSATVPNPYEFANWIGRTKRKKIFVTGTSRRPVPLEHCLYYSGELYKICDNDNFLPQGVKEARDAFNVKNTPKSSSSSGQVGCFSGAGRGVPGRGRNIGRGTSGQRGSGSMGMAERSSSGGWKPEAPQWYSLIKNLSKKGLLPVVVFCFSKNRCDKSADSLTAIDLTSTSEKSEIRVFCDKGFSRLKGSDRRLPQVVRVEGLLRRGIGVHHAGLLPIVKEVVEMLFCRGVIKVLFSTETFAMGVNAPARTVAFHSFRKHDGKTFRQLYPGEYTQMAGRAGRRGLDKVGTVIIMCWDEIPEEVDLKGLLTGTPTKLESQFRLTYNMILNLLRVEDLKVEDMLKRSFAEFHAQRSLPEQQQQLQAGEGELSQMNTLINCILGDPTIEEYYELAVEAENLGNQLHEAMIQSKGAQSLLTPGRVVVVYTPFTPVPTLGVILKASMPNLGLKHWIVLAINRGTDLVQYSTSKPTESMTPAKSPADGYYISSKSSRGIPDDYSVTGRASRKGTGIVKVTLPYFGTTGGTGYVAMELENKGIVTICKSKIPVDTVRLLEDVSSAAYSLTVQQLLQLEKEYPGQDPPALDPIKDLRLGDLAVVEKYYARQMLLNKMAINKCHRCTKLQEHYNLFKSQSALKEKVKQLKYELSDAALQQMPDFQQRIEVLQDVGCINFELAVQLKGRVACEINSGDELIATECLFENQLVDLDAAEAVALLSALVFQQKDASVPMLTPRLKAAKDRMTETAIRLGNLQAKYGLKIVPEDYARDTLKFGLVEVVYEWAKGTPFAEICELTDVPEGSIKMADASEAIKRDIVFAASLYVTGVPT